MTREQWPMLSDDFESFVRAAAGTAWNDPTLQIRIDPDDMVLLWETGSSLGAIGGEDDVPAHLHNEAMLLGPLRPRPASDLNAPAVHAAPPRSPGRVAAVRTSR